MGKLRASRVKAAESAPATVDPLPVEAFDPERLAEALETLRRQTKTMQIKLRVLETAASGGLSPVRAENADELRRALEQERSELDARKTDVEQRLTEAAERLRSAEDQLQRAGERETAATAQAEVYAKELDRLRGLVDEAVTRQRDEDARSVEALSSLTAVVASLQGNERAGTELARAAEKQTEAYEKELTRLRELVDEIATREREHGIHPAHEAVTKLSALVASLQSSEQSGSELARAAAAQTEAYEQELTRLRGLVDQLDDHYRVVVDSVKTEFDRSADVVEDAVAKLNAVAASIQADESARTALAQQESDLAARAAEISELEAALAETRTELDERAAALTDERAAFESRADSFEGELTARTSRLEQREREIHDKAHAFEQRSRELDEERVALNQARGELAEREREIADEASAVAKREQEVVERERAVETATTELASERAALEQERSRVEAEANRLGAEADELANDRSELERRSKEIDLQRRELAKRTDDLAKRERKLRGLDAESKKLEDETRRLSSEREALAAQTQSVYKREQKVSELEARERALLTAAADLKQRQESFAVRVGELERREKQHARERDELARRMAALASELQPEAKDSEPREDDRPAPVEQPEPTPPVGNRARWNIDELERLVEARSPAFPERADEWRYTLFYLRPLTGSDGLVPTNLASVVEETFGELISG